MASEQNDTTTACPICGQPPMDKQAIAYRNMRWRESILQDTPPDVWRQYEADGIGLRRAVEMEMSYAG
jgi:hypothetical protein